MSGLLRRLGSVLGKWKGTALRPPTQHTASTQPSVPKPMESPTVLPLTLNPAPQMPQTLNPMPTATPSSSSAVSAEVASSQAAVEAQPPSLKMLNRHDRKNAQRKATSLPKSSGACSLTWRGLIIFPLAHRSFTTQAQADFAGRTKHA